MKQLFMLAACLSLVLTSNVSAQDADAILGKWFTDKKTSTVEVYKCDDKYCGKIVWLKEPKNQDGTDKLDTHNPEASKRSQKIIGLNIVWGFKYGGENKWSGGKIYDPKNGKTYKCKMSLEDNQLKLRGYVGISVFGRTTVWTRK